MSSSQHNVTDVGTGAERAAEVNESFLGVPGYADDTFFFVIRYVDKAKVGIASHGPRLASVLQRTANSAPAYYAAS